jgi:hypothetical protein
MLPSRWQLLRLPCLRRRRNRAVLERQPTSDWFRGRVQPKDAISCRQLNCVCPAGQGASRFVPRVHPKMNTGKEPVKCGMRPSSLPSSLRYDAASCFDAARSAECAPIWFPSSPSLVRRAGAARPPSSDFRLRKASPRRVGATSCPCGIRQWGALVIAHPFSSRRDLHFKRGRIISP